MRRFAVLAVIVVFVAASVFAVEVTRNAQAQNQLPTPEGQLGGRPSLTSTVPIPSEQDESESTPSPEEPSCAGAFAAEIRQGPNAGRSFDGVLSLAVEPSGQIDNAAIVTTDGERYAVVGQANGRALNLLIELRDNQYLFAIGTLEQSVGACQGLAGGSFVGPQPGDAGDWYVCFGASLPESENETASESVLSACA